MSLKSWGGRGLVATTLAVVLAACGTSPANTGAAAPPVTTQPESTVATPQAASTKDGRPTPTNVRIPKIGAESTLVAVGLDKAKAIEVPSVDQPMQAAWYKHSQVPGDPGPSILLGHVDGKQKPGIFYKLNDLKVGDEIFVKRADGQELRFVATRTQQVPKEQLPEEAIFGTTTESELRLITCGGAFDKAAHSYKDNIIVYAKLAA
jgi:sortase (surface protein transpeptidase)